MSSCYSRACSSGSTRLSLRSTDGDVRRSPHTSSGSRATEVSVTSAPRSVGGSLRQILKSSDIEAVVLPPKSPNLNAHLERANRIIDAGDEVGRKDGELSCRPRLGGLLRYYYRDAA